MKPPKPAPKYRIQLRPQMPTITPEAARDERYQILTNPVSLHRETAIFRDIESTMEPCGAVWIDNGNGTYSAARKKRDLKEAALSPIDKMLRDRELTARGERKRKAATRETLPVEMLVSADTRRERVTVETHEGFRQSITPQPPADFDEIDIAVESLRSRNFEERGAQP